MPDLTPKAKDFWTGLTDRQKDIRTAFFTEQSKTAAAARAAKNPVAASGHFMNTSADARAKSAKFYAEQETIAKAARAATNPVTASGHFMNITEEKRAERKKFETDQALARVTAPARQVTAKTEMKTKAATSTSSQMSLGKTFNFHIAIPEIGIVLGNFRRVSGVTTNEMDFETYREGGDNGPEHYLPTHTKNGRIELEWALRYPDPFMAWCIEMGTGKMVSHAMTITLREKAMPIAMWIVPQCMLVKIEAPEMDAMSSEVATNKVELIHSGLTPVPMATLPNLYKPINGSLG